MDFNNHMKQFLILLSLILLTACGAKIHPLEEPAKFRLPQVVKSEDLIQEPEQSPEHEIIEEENIEEENSTAAE